MKTGNPRNPSHHSQVQQSDSERGRREASVRDDARSRDQSSGNPPHHTDDEEE